MTTVITTEANVGPLALGPLKATSSVQNDSSTLIKLLPPIPTSSPLAEERLVERIAEVIASYRISGPGDMYDNVMKPKVLDTLRSFVAAQEPINMLVPAYPFKSPNHESKVLGPDPDVGERMTLQHFNSIGAQIEQFYPPGGHVTIVSDGVCYNDLLGVSDEEVFRYAKGLHRIADKLGMKHLKFTDIFELIGGENPPTTAEEYASRVGKLKDHLFSEFLPPGYNFDEDIKQNNNALLTYRGYIKFLEVDLAMSYREKRMSKSASKKYSSKVARGMIERGKAFSALVASNSPLHVRLSIHASDNSRKISVALLPHERYSNFPITPWHSTPYLDVTSDSLSLGRKPTNGDVKYEVHKDELGLEFLCADVPMYKVIDTEQSLGLNQRVKLEPLYPCGLKVTVPKETRITRISLQNVTDLAQLHSPIIFEGLDPLLYTSEVASDFHRMANDGLSLGVLHEGFTTSPNATKAASYFVDISSLQDTLPAVEGQATWYEQEQERFVGPLGNSLLPLDRQYQWSTVLA